MRDCDMAEKKAGVTSVVIISKEYKKEKGFRKLSHKHSESAIRFWYAALFSEKLLREMLQNILLEGLCLNEDKMCEQDPPI